MADIPDNKQKQLKSLNQDILAVNPQRASQTESSREKPTGGAPRQPGGSTGSGSAAARNSTAGSRVDRSGSRSMKSRFPVGLSLSLAVILVLIGGLGYGLWQEQLDRQALAQQLATFDDRVAGLEEQLAAADRELDGSEEAVQENVIQLGTRVRDMNRRLSRVANRMEQLSEQQAQQGEQLGNVLSGLQSQQQRTESLATELRDAGARPEGVSEREFTELEERVERISSDIRSLYRLLESR